MGVFEIKHSFFGLSGKIRFVSSLCFSAVVINGGKTGRRKSIVDSPRVLCEVVFRVNDAYEGYRSRSDTGNFL